MLPRRIAVAAVIAALLAAITAVGASAEDLIPSVGVKPATTTTDDPNSGQWFVSRLAPAQTGRMEAIISNPAKVDQTIRLAVADLQFLKDGTPQLVEPPTDIGTWATFDNPLLTVPAGAIVKTAFSMTVPDGAEPGDHVGVLVADTLAGSASAAQGVARIGVVRRVATRLYVTVPGDARKDFVIERVTMKPDAWFFPHEMSVETTLRNTGRVRLHPTVRVSGAWQGIHDAHGPNLLLTKAIENYLDTRRIPWWGGPLRYRIDAVDDSGLARQVRVTKFLIPWHLIAAALLIALTIWGVRRWMRRSRGRYASLQADLRRLESLLASKSEPERARDPDPKAAMAEAAKRARRAKDVTTEQRLREVMSERALPSGPRSVRARTRPRTSPSSTDGPTRRA